MSRIGKKPIDVPSNVKVEINGQTVKASGPLGNLQMQCHPMIRVKQQDNQVLVENPTPDHRAACKLHGTMRALIANMVTGVSKGFERKIEIYGTGYNIKEQSGKLVFQVGFCHPVAIKLPKDIKVNIEVPATKGNEVPAKFSLSGPDKAELGQLAADIRKIRPPEPYQGKGIRYADEQVRRKVGKAFASGAA